MKKIVFVSALICLFVLTSFKLNDSYPCHPNGDLGPCEHVVHSLGDLGPCGHTYYDAWGNLRTVHEQDLYPCTHRQHVGDIYPCTHICF